MTRMMNIWLFYLKNRLMLFHYEVLLLAFWLLSFYSYVLETEITISVFIHRLYVCITQKTGTYELVLRISVTSTDANTSRMFCSRQKVVLLVR